MDGIVEPQSLPGLEGQVNEYDEAQLQAAASRRVFEANEGPYPWLDVYWELRARGWDWRKAVYIAWLAMPEGHRQPKTQHELATEILGLASDRRLREWRRDNPALEEEAIQLLRNRVFSALPAVMEALVESASTPSGRNHADRRTYLELIGAMEQFDGDREGLPEDLSDQSTDRLRRRLAALKARNDVE